MTTHDDLGWELTQPGDHGFDTGRLASIGPGIEAFERPDFQALLVARHGRLVFERYFNGHDTTTLTDMRSAGKSVTSTLIGIAIDQGLIDGVSACVVPSFDRYAPLDWLDERKSAMTLDDLLTMRGGLDADDWDPSSPGAEETMLEASDWIEHSLNLPMAQTPGTTWVYAGACPMLLVGVLETASGGDVFDFATEHLFGPLGITNLRWERSPQGRIAGQGFLSLTARDALKIGQVILDGGTWKDRRIVSEAWVRQATRMHVDFDPLGTTGRMQIARQLGVGYGYQWWRGRHDLEGRRIETVIASGNGGNHIQIVPELDLVAVLQSTAYNVPHANRRSFDLFEAVLDAVKP